MIVNVYKRLHLPLHEARDEIRPSLQTLASVDYFIVPSLRNRLDFLTVSQQPDIGKIAGHRVELIGNFVAVRHPGIINQRQGSINEDVPNRTKSSPVFPLRAMTLVLSCPQFIGL